MTWQRARRPEQKDERRRAILESAAALFSEHGYDGVSLSAIARGAGLAKSNLYNYFDTKEDIFLTIYLHDLGRWVDAAERALAPLAGCNDPDAVAQALTTTVASQPRMNALLTLVFGALERNVSYERVLEFNTALSEYVARIVNLLRQALPAISPGDAVQFLMQTYALVTGLWQMGNPPEVVDQVLRRRELAYLRLDFRSALEAALGKLLRQSIENPDLSQQPKEPQPEGSPGQPVSA